MKEILDVECLICNEVFNSTLTTHMKRIHDITSKEYCDKFGVPKEELMTTEFRKIKVKQGNINYESGKIGNNIKDLNKRHKEWLKSEDAKVFFLKSNAKKRFEKGREKQQEYWTKDKRKEKSEFMKVEQKRRLKEGIYNTKAVEENKNNFKKMREIEHLKFISLRNICTICKTEYSPQYLVDTGLRKSLRSIGSTNNFKKLKYCSKKCRSIGVSKIRKSKYKNMSDEEKKEIMRKVRSFKN